VSALAEAGVVSWIDETDRAKVDARNGVGRSKSAVFFTALNKAFESTA
jgi:hypothetical protein